MNSTSNPIHSGVARNHAEAHENKIHSDEMAARFGFKGALVPGVTVFGLTSIALTKQFGPGWLEGNTVHTRFIKPAYHNEELDVFLTSSGSTSEARCTNKDATLLCTLQLQQGVAASEFGLQGFDLNAKPTPANRANRQTICWDAIHEDQPFPVRSWQPSAQENAKLAAEVDDHHSAFSATGTGLVHPHLLLSHANQVLVDQFEMPAWIHVGSELRLHRALHQDTTYRTFAKPVRKWKHKGHEFLTIYIAYEAGGEASTEIWHTAIYRVAGA